MPEDAAPAQPENAATVLLGGRMAEQMPDVDLSTVSNHAQATEPLKTTGKAKESASRAALVDAQGRTFNPLLHETDAQGNPVLRKGTNILKCRRIPLKGARQESRIELGAADSQPEAGDIGAEQEQAIDPMKRAAMQQAGAATIAGLQVQLMRLALGEHTANSNAEREMLTEAWREVFAHYNMGAVHPLVGLAVVTGAVVVSAIQQPEGRSRWQRFTQWARLKIGGLLFRMTGKQPTTEQEP